ncbi:MAG TPA: hypothetical protein VND83_02775 [Acidimicrobiales bacterium]|nr:hypothetical protein [Acidimicrobiales bacterium]
MLFGVDVAFLSVFIFFVLALVVLVVLTVRFIVRRDRGRREEWRSSAGPPD